MALPKVYVRGRTARILVALVVAALVFTAVRLVLAFHDRGQNTPAPGPGPGIFPTELEGTGSPQSFELKPVTFEALEAALQRFESPASDKSPLLVTPVSTQNPSSALLVGREMVTVSL